MARLKMSQSAIRIDNTLPYIYISDVLIQAQEIRDLFDLRNECIDYLERTASLRKQQLESASREVLRLLWRATLRLRYLEDKYKDIANDDYLQNLENILEKCEKITILIHRDSFKEYAIRYADETNAINPTINWPHNCIDWNEAARELQLQYHTLNFNGVLYYYLNEGK